MMSKRSPAICLMGPTASGKTALAVELARVLPVEVVSVDSALVYRGMDIGTAKPDAVLLREVPHHLVDIRDAKNSYSVADFRADAVRVMGEITDRGKIPLLVGGTMLYFKALKEGLATMPRANADVRQAITQLAAEFGWSVVHERLSEVDPVAAKRIHENDPQRLQRALEVYEISGKSMTDWQLEAKLSQDNICPFDLLEIAVMPQHRADLHLKIEARFDQMLIDGFVAEVEGLYQREDLTAELPSMRAVGYRQVWDYLEGKSKYEEMRDKAIIATRQFAKRQFTWLRSWQNLKQISQADLNEALKIVHASSILE